MKVYSQPWGAGRMFLALVLIVLLIGVVAYMALISR